MRKLVWCGAALMVSGAVAVYLSADYAAKHPNSALGRCAAAAAYVGLCSNPFVHAAALGPTHLTHGSAALVGSAVGSHGQAVKCRVPKPVPGVEPEPREVREAAEPAELNEPVRPEVPEANEPDEQPGRDVDNAVLFGPGKIEEVPGTTSERQVLTPVEDQPIQSHSFAIDEYDFRMPIADTEDVETIPVPATETVYESIPAPADEAAEEEESACEVESIPAPTEEEESAVEEPSPLTCVEGACVETCRTACSGWLQQILKLFGMTPEATEPTTPDESTPQSEGTEGQNSSPPSSYHHGCPYLNMGCPYSGGCPYPYSRPAPVTTPAPTEQPKEVDPKKAPEDEMSWLEMVWKKMFAVKASMSSAASQSSCPANNSSEIPRKKKKLFGRFLDDQTRQTGIDTMEFRPTDDPRDPPGTHPF
jgi:hypothetical protein